MTFLKKPENPNEKIRVSGLPSARNPDYLIFHYDAKTKVGLATLGDILLNPAKEVLTSRSVTGSATCAIAQTNLGPDVAIIGAASLAMLKCDVVSQPKESARILGGKFSCHFTSV